MSSCANAPRPKRVFVALHGENIPEHIWKAIRVEVFTSAEDAEEHTSRACEAKLNITAVVVNAPVNAAGPIMNIEVN